MNDISELIGKVMAKVEQVGSERLEFHCDDGSVYAFFYEHDCCASCDIEDIVSYTQLEVESGCLPSLGEWHPISPPTDAPAQGWYKASEVEAWIAGCIPTNWCDPLLTGDRRVIGDAPYNCDDIEALLAGIKRRLLDRLRKGRG